MLSSTFFFFQAEDGIRDSSVTGVQTCALPICPVQRWEDNRIGFTEDRVWRYDPCGNRIAQMQADHSQQQLHYDYAKAWVAAFKPGWEKLGCTVVAENAMSYNRATDVYSGVSKD